MNATKTIFQCLLVVGVLCSQLIAGGGPENVLLVVNADSASSKMIANYYIHGRKIPARNVVYLNGIPDREFTNEDVFRDKILKPIVQEIEERKLALSIDYIIYSSDFPTMVTNAKHFVKLRNQLKEETGQQLQAKLYAPNASLTSMTYFAGATINDNPGYLGLDSNTYYRLPANKILRRPFSPGPSLDLFRKATEVARPETEEASDSKILDESIVALGQLMKKNPQQPALTYWAARRYAQKGNASQAAKAITFAIRQGWAFRKYTQTDPYFEKVQDDPLFKGIVARMPDLPFEFAPTRGFKQKYTWGPNGFLNAEPGQGNRFFISSILAVTRNHGNNEKEALRQLKRSMAADETNPQGTFYFADTADVRTKARRANFDKAISALKQLGHNATIIKTAMPIKANDVLGVTTGTPQFSWTKTGSKIVAGAFCDNLTSFGGRMHKPGQTRVSEFLANGAAGASGTIVEPYAIQNKFPHPMVHVHYARGCSLGEAFYQSVYGPFQILLVGDALCQPWATKPKVRIKGIKPGDEIKDKVKIFFDVESSPVGISGYELYVDGVLAHRTANKDSILLDTVNMSDGYHEIRIVAWSDGSIESTQSIVIPVSINNKGESTQLTTEHPDYLDTDTITFRAKSNFGDSIELMHNGRSIAKKIGTDVEFKIKAALLGRGPVKVEALAISETRKSVASLPVSLQIDGRLSERKVDTETPPKKEVQNPKKTPAGK